MHEEGNAQREGREKRGAGMDAHPDSRSTPPLPLVPGPPTTAPAPSGRGGGRARELNAESRWREQGG